MFPGFTEENYILLDVIYRQKLPTWAELKPATHAWLKIENEPTLLTLSTKEGLLGDKLTAFAPTTTGILYSKNRPLEIVKQLYDIGTLFDQVDDLKLSNLYLNRWLVSRYRSERLRLAHRRCLMMHLMLHLRFATVTKKNRTFSI